MIFSIAYLKLPRITSFPIVLIKRKSWATLCLVVLFINGCTGINSSNPIERSKAINEKEFSQDILAKYSIDDGSSIVRMAAINKLTDQTLLAKIVQEEKETSVRKAAMDRLTDQVLLADIVVKDERREVRQEAIMKLTNQALLMKIAEEDSRLEICMEAVKEIIDQALLAELAMEDKRSEVRLIAVKKLEVQTLLTKIAAENSQPEICIEAVKKITDQVSLTKLAMEGKRSEVRLIAVNKITDRTLLAKLAMESSLWEVRLEAVKKITDQILLSKLAVEEKKLSVRKEIWNRLTDPVLLAKTEKTIKQKKILALYSTVPKIRLVLTEKYDKKGEEFEIENLKPITEFMELIGFKLSQDKTAPTLYVNISTKPRLVYYNHPQWFAGSSNSTVTFQVSPKLTLEGNHHVENPIPRRIPFDRKTYPLRKSSIWQLTTDVACAAILDAISNAGESSIPVLTNALKHKSMRVRLAAVHALQKTESPAAIYPLVSALRDTDGDSNDEFDGYWVVAEAASKAIEDYGKAATEPLLINDNYFFPPTTIKTPVSCLF